MSDITRMTIFSATGGRLADIRPDLQSVEWRLNRAGLAKFRMAYTDAKATANNLSPGNYLLIEFENGLPDWAGVLDFPLEQDEDGVTVSAFSAERLLDWRVSEADWQFNGLSPGATFELALSRANAVQATGIVAGNIYGGGTGYTQRWHYYQLLRRTADLARLSDHDMEIGYTLSGGRFQWLGNWYETRGSDLTSSVLLTEGANVTSASMLSQGPIANVVIAVGEGAEWGDRPTATATDSTSIAAYGYRQYVEMVSTEDEGTLQGMADALLAQMSEPRRRISLQVTNRSPGLFSSYDIGDIVDTLLFVRGGSDWAYSGPVRIIGRSWSPDGACDLEVEEWLE